jgi:hypothetical protein
MTNDTFETLTDLKRGETSDPSAFPAVVSK